MKEELSEVIGKAKSKNHYMIILTENPSYLRNKKRGPDRNPAPFLKSNIL